MEKFVSSDCKQNMKAEDADLIKMTSTKLTILIRTLNYGMYYVKPLKLASVYLEWDHNPLQTDTLINETIKIKVTFWFKRQLYQT